jgi:hypothetical protein
VSTRAQRIAIRSEAMHVVKGLSPNQYTHPSGSGRHPRKSAYPTGSLSLTSWAAAGIAGPPAISAGITNSERASRLMHFLLVSANDRLVRADSSGCVGPSLWLALTLMQGAIGSAIQTGIISASFFGIRS